MVINKKVTLWLLPPPSVRDKLQANIDELSQEYYGSAPFVPHVTVVGGISYESRTELDEIVDILTRGLQNTGCISCRFHNQVVNMYNPDDSLVWNQACVSVMKRTDEFMAFHQRVCQLLGIQNEN